MDLKNSNEHTNEAIHSVEPAVYAFTCSPFIWMFEWESQPIVNGSYFDRAEFF